MAAAAARTEEPLKAPVEISTARLSLTRPPDHDAAEVFERYAGDPDVTKYLGAPSAVEDTEVFLAFRRRMGTLACRAVLIRRRTDNRLLGGTGLGFESAAEAMTGYVLARDAWGQGYATEALTAMVELARAIPVARLSALCHPEHRASWRVLEKCGFARRADWSQLVELPNLEPGRPQPVLRYEILLSGE